MAVAGLVVGLALTLAACDDDSSESGTTTSSGTGGAAGEGGSSSGAGSGGATGGNGGQGGLPNEEGKVTITASNLENAGGKRLIATVLDQGTSDQLGAICETIAGNPGSASGVVSEASAMDVCDLGAEVVFQPGTYDVAAGIYAQGQPAPELCAATTVTVGGDVTVTLTSFSSCM